jgi:glycosyltransferase involved in cell wall biosynthesis
MGQPILLHLANLHPQKNHRLIVNAFAQVLQVYPNAKLVMAGAMDGYPELYDSLRADIQQLEIGSSVDLVGALDRRKLSRLMANAHVGLLPSILEGFSIATLEFAFYGLPSVLSATGSAQELQNQFGHVEIAQGCALSPNELSVHAIEAALRTFPSGSVPALANAILKLMADYPYYLEKAMAAGNGFSNYAVEHTATQLNTLLHQLEDEEKIHAVDS